LYTYFFFCCRNPHRSVRDARGITTASAAALRRRGGIREIGSGPFSAESECKEGGEEREEKGKEKQADTVHRAKCVFMLRAPDERTPAASARGATAKGRGTDRSEETK